MLVAECHSIENSSKVVKFPRKNKHPSDIQYYDTNEREIETQTVQVGSLFLSEGALLDLLLARDVLHVLLEQFLLIALVVLLLLLLASFFRRCRSSSHKKDAKQTDTP